MKLIIPLPPKPTCDPIYPRDWTLNKQKNNVVYECLSCCSTLLGSSFFEFPAPASFDAFWLLLLSEDAASWN